MFKNELIKLYNKKLIICTLIIILYVICTNLIYKYKMDEQGNIIESIDYKKEIEIYKDKLDNCINCSDSTINEYKYIIEKYKIKEKYGEDSWQSYVFDNIIDFNDDSYIEKFEKGNWKYYVYNEMDDNKDNKKYIETLNYRLENNIEYGYNYLNYAIDEYINTDDEYGINKYIMDTKYNVNKVNNLRGILINFFTEYEILIIVVLLIICGGIITDENNKGTIRQLLILPKKRSSILLYKYISIIIVFISLFLFILLLQLIIGIIMFDTISLKIPVIILGNKYSIFKYLVKMLIYKIPILLLLPMLIIFLNLITNNITITVLFSLIFYITSKILLLYSNAKSMFFIKYLLNVHWDLSVYLYRDGNINTSICISVLYLLILSIISIIKFNRMDIKNS